MFCIIFCICAVLLLLSFANPMTPYSKAYQVNLNNRLLLSHVYGYINRDDTLIPFLIIADLPRPLKATQIPPLKRNGYTISDNTDHPRLYGRGVSAPTILVVVYPGKKCSTQKLTKEGTANAMGCTCEKYEGRNGNT